MSKTVNEIEVIKAARVSNISTGEEYILDFSRESAVFAQERGFDPDEVATKPTITVPNLFYYSLRKNHRAIARNQAEKLFETLFPDGMPMSLVERLTLLYQQAALVNIVVGDEEGKNPGTAVVLD